MSRDMDPVPKTPETRLTDQQRRDFMERATDLLPPLEFVDKNQFLDGTGESEPPEPLESRYRAGDSGVILFGCVTSDQGFDTISVLIFENTLPAKPGEYFTQLQRDYMVPTEEGLRLGFDDEYREAKLVFGGRGLRLKDQIRSDNLDEESGREYSGIIETTEYSLIKPLPAHFGELMKVLALCGPDNFLPSPEPGGVRLI